MARYILVYHGGGMPETPEAQAEAMAQWGAWIGELGEAMPDPGAPVGKSATITPDGVEHNGGANPVSGYSIVEADSVEAAHEMAKGCPVLNVGGTVEVAPIMAM